MTHFTIIEAAEVDPSQDCYKLRSGSGRAIDGSRYSVNMRLSVQQCTPGFFVGLFEGPMSL